MISFGNFALILIIIIVLHGAEAQRYGVDVSFPMQHETVSSNYDHLPHNQAPASHPTVMKYHEMPIQPLGDRQKEYSKFIKGCVDTFNATSCGEFEEGRIEMNLRQPASMVNYTKTGFHKTRTTDGLWQLIQGFWERNKDKQEKEVWPAGNTFVNHWSAPSYLVRIIEDKALRGEGPRLAKAIWDETKKSMQDWTGQELEDCSMYGIRIYTEGSILNPHVDRLPLVMSAVINVAQDVDEEWPMEFIGHDGKALNITMKPGDMILYESHSVLHGRPFPLKGKHFANIFVHFEPTGHSMKYHDYDASMSKGVKGIGKYSVNKEIGGHEIEVRDMHALDSRKDLRLTGFAERNLVGASRSTTIYHSRLSRRQDLPRGTP